MQHELNVPAAVSGLPAFSSLPSSDAFSPFVSFQPDPRCQFVENEAQAPGVQAKGQVLGNCCPPMTNTSLPL
jgi:hypothetical protein